MLAIIASLLVSGAPEAPPKPPTLLTPEALVTEGFRRSRIVIINEGHDGDARNINSRAVVMRVLESARKAGASHLALEALPSGGFVGEVNRTRELPQADGGYLAQPEMRALIEAALFMGFTLVSYDQLPSGEGATDLRKASPEQRLALANARDEAQAESLATQFGKIPPGAKLLVLCSNSHVYEATERGWTYMASRLKKKSLVDPFTIDQTRALRWTKDTPESPVVAWLKPQLEKLPINTGGFYAGAVPDKRYAKETGADAYLVSTNDRLE